MHCLHQLKLKYTRYDGIPQWLSEKFDPPQHPYPWPMKDTSGISRRLFICCYVGNPKAEDCIHHNTCSFKISFFHIMKGVQFKVILTGYSTWACGYFSEEVSNGFDQLYTKHQQEFANVWKEIAIRLEIKIAHFKESNSNL